MNPQNKTKKFNLEASVRYKRKTVEEHARTAQHTASVEAELISRVSTFQKQIDKRDQVREDVYYNAFLTLYWIAKEELPNRKFTSLLELLEKLNLPDIDYFQHRSGGSVREMFLVLGRTIKEQVQQKTCMANFFSILCDEVCDISNKEQLVTFVQYVDQDSSKADVKFLAVDDVLEEFTSANAIAIKSMIFKQIDDSELDVSKLTAIDPAIKYTIDQLREIATSQKPLERLKKDLGEGGRLSISEVKLTSFNEQYLRNLTVKYVGSLTENIENRFAESVPVLSAFKIFDPMAVPCRSDEEFKEYDWALQHILAMRTTYEHFIPGLLRIAEVCLSLPVSNAWPERGASAVKRLKTRLRSSIKNDILEALMHVTINGPDVILFHSYRVTSLNIHHEQWHGRTRIASYEKNPYSIAKRLQQSCADISVDAVAELGYKSHIEEGVSAIPALQAAICGRVATCTTFGFIADDPTDPTDLGDAAKRFYDAGTVVSCSGIGRKCRVLVKVIEGEERMGQAGGDSSMSEVKVVIDKMEILTLDFDTRKVVQQYQSYSEETDFATMSRSTLCEILKVCSASVRKSLQGLDYISAEGAKAFDEIGDVIEKLGDMYGKGHSWTKEQTNELNLAKRYLQGDYKVLDFLKSRGIPPSTISEFEKEKVLDFLKSRGIPPSTISEFEKEKGDINYNR
ncbi:hypothetical protein QZH41_001963 [Actinostola sp. cb2023]|nr:hypothetical protein QZH41_001963 [Actinostola sp. cb2023]